MIVIIHMMSSFRWQQGHIGIPSEEGPFVLSMLRLSAMKYIIVLLDTRNWLSGLWSISTLQHPYLFLV